MPEQQRSRNLPEAISRRLVPDTLELIRHAGYQDVKEIVPATSLRSEREQSRAESRHIVTFGSRA